MCTCTSESDLHDLIERKCFTNTDEKDRECKESKQNYHLPAHSLCRSEFKSTDRFQFQKFHRTRKADEILRLQNGIRLKLERCIFQLSVRVNMAKVLDVPGWFVSHWGWVFDFSYWEWSSWEKRINEVERNLIRAITENFKGIVGCPCAKIRKINANSDSTTFEQSAGESFKILKSWFQPDSSDLYAMVLRWADLSLC